MPAPAIVAVRCTCSSMSSLDSINWLALSRGAKAVPGPMHRESTHASTDICAGSAPTRPTPASACPTPRRITSTANCRNCCQGRHEPLICQTLTATIEWLPPPSPFPLHLPLLFPFGLHKVSQNISKFCTNYFDSICVPFISQLPPSLPPSPPIFPPLLPPPAYIMHKHIRNHIHWRIKKQFESGLTQPKHLATGNLQLATRNRQLFAANAARDEPQDVPAPAAHPPLSLSVSLFLPRDGSLSHTNKSQFAAACEIFSQQLRLLCILHLRNHKITPPPSPPSQIPLRTTDKPIRKSTWQGHGSGSARAAGASFVQHESATR